MSRRASASLLLVFVGIFAVGYLVVLPPFGWGDEVPHFLRAYRISRGQPMAASEGGRRGAWVPHGVDRLVRSAGLTAMAWEECTLGPSQLAPVFAIQAMSDDSSSEVFLQEYGAPYPPLASAHTTLGLLLARSVTDHPVYWLYGARAAGLVVWLALGLVALRMAPDMRATLLALLVTPTALFLAATCSVDGLLDAVAFLWMAYVLRLSSGHPIRPDGQTVAAVIGFSVVLGLMKLVYAPLVLMLLVVPAGQEKPMWAAWVRLTFSGVLVGAISAVGWIALAGGGPTDAVVFGAKEGQIFDPLRVVTDPVGTSLAIFRTIRVEWYPWLINLSWPKYTRCMELHATAVPIVWGAILLALVADGGGWRPTPLQRCVGAGVFSLVLLTTLLVALATWTPAEVDRAIGVHARYLLPALPGLAIALVPPIARSNRRFSVVLRACVFFAMFVANGLVLVAFLRQYDWSS